MPWSGAFVTVIRIRLDGGALLSSFAAYMPEKKASNPPEGFDNGAIEGVAAPESTNNAGAQTFSFPR
jgi:TctA family transporter